MTSPSAPNIQPLRRSRGRPSGFAIVGDRLSELRERKGLSHLELHRRAIPDAGISEESRERACRRWEADNKVKDLATAQAIAQVLRTSVAVLQGSIDEPKPDRFKDLEEQLVTQKAKGNPALDEMLTGSHGEERSIASVTRELAMRIELAQITRQHERLEQLSQLTGWSLRELQQPANHEGYWMVSREDAMGGAEHRVFLGMGEALLHVEMEVRNWLPEPEGEARLGIEPDSRLAFYDEAPWYRLTLKRPRVPWQNKTLSFVRCEPGETGLMWTRPSSFEQSDIYRLPGRFWNRVNFMEGWRLDAPPANLRDLRLIVERRDLERATQAFKRGEPEPPHEVIGLVDGSVRDLDEELLARFATDGTAHALVVNRLYQGLWDALMPHMLEWPRESWVLEEVAGGFVLRPEPHGALYRQFGRMHRMECWLTVRMVALRSDGTYYGQPWRLDSIREVMRIVKRHLEELPSAPPPDQKFIGPISSSK